MQVYIILKIIKFLLLSITYNRTGINNTILIAMIFARKREKGTFTEIKSVYFINESAVQ